VSSTISTVVAMGFVISELLDLPGSGSNPVRFDQFKESKSIPDGTDNFPATKHVTFEPTLSAGTLTIDLTAAHGTEGTQDLTGLKLQALYFKNTGTNAVTLTAHGTNGYLLFGASGSVIIPPAGAGGLGGQLQIFFPESLPDVGPTAKQLLLTGTGTDAFEMSMIFG
jgi:hypothetical protein